MRENIRLGMITGLLAFTVFFVPVAHGASRHGHDCGALIEGIRARYDGRLNNAVTSFERAIFEKGDVAAAYLHLGLTWELKGNLSKAREYYQQAVDARPDYSCARYYLDRLPHGDAPVKKVDTILERVTPEKIMNNFSRYRGQQVKLEGELMCWPCTKGPKPIMLVSSTPLEQRLRQRDVDQNMENVFIVRLKEPLPDDSRVRRGASVEVRGIVRDRDFAWHPLLRVFSSEKKPVIEPQFITFEESQGRVGPLNMTF